MKLFLFTSFPGVADTFDLHGIILCGAFCYFLRQAAALKILVFLRRPSQNYFHERINDVLIKEIEFINCAGKTINFTS